MLITTLTKTMRIGDNMSPVEIIIYSLLGCICLGLLFKWIVYDKYIKPKRKPKNKKEKPKKYEDEEGNE